MIDSVSNLSALAKKNIFQSVVGRPQEIQCLVDILCRSKKSNPILIGPLGVGRSSIMMGLAKYISNHEVPDKLQKTVIQRIDFNALLMNADDPFDVFKQLIEALCLKKQRTLFVFDELETLLHVDVTLADTIFAYIKNLLINKKQQGVLVCNEKFYQRYIVSDVYLMRDCMPIPVCPPNDEQAIEILQAHAEQIKSHYSIDVPEDVISSVMKFSRIYLLDTCMPESAVNLLDAVAARIKARRLHETMTREEVVNVVSEWTGIDATVLQLSLKNKVLNCAKSLSSFVYGQKHALEMVERLLQIGCMRLATQSPVAIMLFVGPRGVGRKTTAFSLNQWLYGSKRHLHRFNMEKYSESSDVEKLLGPLNTTDIEGDLTRAMRRSPYSICLFERIESAHPRVLQSLHQVLMMHSTDKCDLSKTIIIMTTDVGSDVIAGQEFIMEKSEKPSGLLQLVANDLPEMVLQNHFVDHSHQSLSEKLQPTLSKEFGDQFLRGVKIIPFTYWDRSDLMHYFADQLGKIKEKMQQENQIDLYYDVGFTGELSHLLSATQHDAIAVKQFIDDKILSEVVRAIFIAKSRHQTVHQLHLMVDSYGEIMCQ